MMNLPSLPTTAQPPSNSVASTRTARTTRPDYVVKLSRRAATESRCGVECRC